MKLSNYVKDAVISAIMQDVPQVDYSRQAEKMFRDALYAVLPDAVKALLSTPEGYRLDSGRVVLPSPVTDSIWVRGAVEKDGEKVSEATRNEVHRLMDLHYKQKKERTALRNKLRNGIYGVNTRAQFIKTFPEFEKYMPAAPEKPSSNLPVDTTVVSSLMQAGWPAKKEEGKADA